MSILKLIKTILYDIHLILNSKIDKSDFRGEIMYIVKADNPDVGFNLAFVVTDSEGNVVPTEGLVVDVMSDDEAVVDVIADETGMAGTVHFGSPGLANVNVTVEDADGELLGSFGAQFTVTVGDPAAISGGTLTFEGLSEAPVVEPAPVVEEPVV